MALESGPGSRARLLAIMNPSDIIRGAVADVERLRQSAASKPALSNALAAVKQFQSRRFENSYRDLLQGGPHQAAARFFLQELYGDADYSQRDVQFARIAGAIERLLPKPAVATAVALARLHALTEQLDYAMALAWQEDTHSSLAEVARYVRAWRIAVRREDRQRQLRLVMEIGQDLEKLTKTPGLRLLLKLMRGPAHAAGLHDLQRFLESGFDTFAAMGKQKIGTSAFLQLIESRESKLIDMLFDAEMEKCATVLSGYSYT